MGLAMQHAQIERLNKKVLNQINFARMKKKTLLSYELVGVSRKTDKELSQHRGEQSDRIGFFPAINKPIKIKQKRMWNKLLQ